MNSLLIIFFLSYGIYAFYYNIKFWIIYSICLIIYYYFTQTVFYHSEKCNIGKKICYSAWSTPYDPQVYTTIKLDITKIIPYLEKKSEEDLKDLNEHYKVTTFTIKLMSLVLKKYPAVYGYIKFGIYEPKEGIDICCLVNVGKGKELANTTLKDCELKTLKEIHMELNSNASLLKERKNKEQNKKMNLYKLIPTFLLGPLAQIFSYISSIGIQIKTLGLKQFEFGSCVITNIGSIGIENSFAPIPPISFAPAILTLCSYYKVNAKNKEGNIENKIYLKMNFTTDYRFFDFTTSVKLFNEIHRIGEDPQIFEEECLKYEKKSPILKKIE
jgi:pyruvate/2-oxoglutarate dehydrogenase complex dihydrolipoamide acyltransferase (E2) component